MASAAGPFDHISAIGPGGNESGGKGIPQVDWLHSQTGKGNEPNDGAENNHGGDAASVASFQVEDFELGSVDGSIEDDRQSVGSVNSTRGNSASLQGILDQRPMRFANPWPEHVRRKEEKKQLHKQVRANLKLQFDEIYAEARKLGGAKERPSASKLFSDELRRRTEEIDRLYATMHLPPNASISLTDLRGSDEALDTLKRVASGDNLSARISAGAANGSTRVRSRSIGGGQRRKGSTSRGPRRPSKESASMAPAVRPPANNDPTDAVETAKARVRSRHQFHGRRTTPEIGCRVDILSKTGKPIWVNCGVLRYIGALHFTSGRWAGVELDKQYQGKNDGQVEGRRYFQTKVPDRGLFVRVECCRRAVSDKAPGERPKRSRKGGEGTGEGEESGEGDGSVPGSPGKGAGTSDPGSLALYKEMEQDEQYAKYFNMLKVGVPRSAIGQKMLADSIPADKIRLFITQGETDADAAMDFEVLILKKKKAPRDTKDSKQSLAENLRTVHWNALDPDAAKRSIFATGHFSRELSPKDVHLLKQHFSRVVASKGKGDKKAKKKKTMEAILISSRRATNIGIMLAKFKDFKAYTDIAHAVLTFDRRLTQERLESLMEMVPTLAECPKLQSYNGPANELIIGEQFCIAMVDIPRIRNKVEALLFCHHMRHSLKSNEKHARELTEVCKEVMASQRLARIFQILLLIGNTMNGQMNQGFSLESLNLLLITKSTTTAKMVLIDFIVQTIAENGEGDLLAVAREMPLISRAVMLPDAMELNKEHKILNEELQRTTREIELEAKRREDEKEVEEEEARKKREAEEETRRAAIEAARLHQEAEEEKSEVNDPAAKYRKMLSVGLPRAAVEQKMEAEGVDPALLDQDPAAAADPAEKYRKMLQVGLPRAAVEIKMHAEGVDPKLLDKKVRDETATDSEDEEGGPSAAAAAPDPADKFRKMLKVGLPRPAVELKMQAEGLDPAVLDSKPDVGVALPTPAPAPAPNSGNPKAAMLAELAGGKGLLKKRRRGIVATKKTNVYAAERDGFVAEMRQRIEVAARDIEQMGQLVAEAADMCSTMRTFFGEKGDVMPSSKIFKIIKEFLDLLASARHKYERAHGRIVSVRHHSRRDVIGLSAGDDEEEDHHNYHIAEVGMRVATAYGPGTVESIRVKDNISSVRLRWGVAYLRSSAIVHAGDIVSTTFGMGEVISLETSHGATVYQVELGWGYAFLQPDSIQWKRRGLIDQESDGNTSDAEDEDIENLITDEIGDILPPTAAKAAPARKSAVSDFVKSMPAQQSQNSTTTAAASSAALSASKAAEIRPSSSNLSDFLRSTPSSAVEPRRSPVPRSSPVEEPDETQRRTSLSAFVQEVASDAAAKPSPRPMPGKRAGSPMPGASAVPKPAGLASFVSSVPSFTPAIPAAPPGTIRARAGSPMPGTSSSMPQPGLAAFMSTVPNPGQVSQVRATGVIESSKTPPRALRTGIALGEMTPNTMAMASNNDLDEPEDSESSEDEEFTLKLEKSSSAEGWRLAASPPDNDAASGTQEDVGIENEVSNGSSEPQRRPSFGQRLMNGGSWGKWKL